MNKSLFQIASQFDTDKIRSEYITAYEKLFSPLREKPIKLLELGVFKGGSLQMWQEYFPNGLILGLDLNSVTINGSKDRIRTFQGRQEDPKLLERIVSEHAADGFDIIIDDAAHIGTLARSSYQFLFHKLKSGGLYIIEDWGTGYWHGWPDGASWQGNPNTSGSNESMMTRVIRKARRLAHEKLLPAKDPNFNSHNFGMVGFIKELVDECGMDDITKPGRGISPHRRSSIAEMVVRPGQVFLTKA